MRVIVRAWNAEGYHKDIVIMDEQQVRMTCSGVDEMTGRHMIAGPLGVGVVIDPKQFPEMIEFQVMIVVDPPLRRG